MAETEVFVSEPRPAPGALPPGRRIYAVGDIHGAIDKLRALHAAIATDLRARPIASALLIYLGDYIDKGPQSRAVLDLLLGAPLPGLATCHLIGNHEAMLRAALAGDRAAAADWLWSGGRETLASFGIDPVQVPVDWADRIGHAYRNFLHGLALYHREGDYLFVHAGIRPGIALEAQAPADLWGIRHDFLCSSRDHGFVVVHGHTAQLAPVVRPNRIGLDTGAWSGGPLTCAVLEGRDLAFLFA